MLKLHHRRNKISLMILLCIVFITYSFGSVADEALIQSAKAKGSTVYYSCIVTPPTSDEQYAWCLGVYYTYVASLQVVNAPYPLSPSITPSKYSWSPFDICRYETSHLVFTLLSNPSCSEL